MTITKRLLKELLGFETDVEVAAFFGTTKQAVNAWGVDEPLPSGRQWQARALRPDVFGPPPAEQVA
jgi:hypothetical protein